MTITQDNDYSLPPSQVYNYCRDKCPPLGTYYLLETSDNVYTFVATDVLGYSDIYVFSRLSNYSTYQISSHQTRIESVQVNISNPLYVYSNVNGVPLEDYRATALTSAILVLFAAILFVSTFLGRFKREKNK